MKIGQLVASRFAFGVFYLMEDSPEYNLENSRWRLGKNIIGIIVSEPQTNHMGQTEILVFMQGRVLKTFPSELYLYSST
jgi:hypothetical protein